MSQPNRMAAISKPSGPWLHAWYDPMAHLHTRSSRICTIDINNDGNYALLVIDSCIRLKVFVGMNLVSSHKLLDEASCMSVFYPSALNRDSNVAAVGVATVNNIYIYRNMRPYYKFTIPNLAINSTEDRIWSDWRSGAISTSNEALLRLKKLKNRLDLHGDPTDDNNNNNDGDDSNNNITNQNQNDNNNNNINSGARGDEIDDTHDLTFRTMFILSITDNDEQLRYMESYKQAPLISQTVITCLSSIQRDSEEYNSVSQLILGTENNEIIFLDSSGANIESRINIPSVPVCLQVTGLLNIDYRVIIATRSHNIYTIRNGKLLGNSIELESDIISMISFNKLIIVACINQTIYAYHHKGMKKQFSLHFGNGDGGGIGGGFGIAGGGGNDSQQIKITCLEHMNINSSKFNNNNQNLYLIGFNNGEVHLYNYNNLIYILKCDPSPITAIKFGKYGREDNSLIILNKTGTLSIKMLSRRHNFESYNNTSSQMGSVGVVNESNINNNNNNNNNLGSNRASDLQDKPLDLPKVTQLFLDQTNREKQNAISMHNTFQKQNIKFKLRVLKEYYNVLLNNNGPLNLSSGGKGGNRMNQKSMVLNVQVKGLGPMFKLQIELKNTNPTGGNIDDNGGKITEHLYIIQNITVLANYDPNYYKINNPVINIPLLIPGLTYNYDMIVNCIQDNGNAKPIHLCIIDKFTQHYPLLSAIVDMPIAEIQ